jgi:hypothetical protein
VDARNLTQASPDDLVRAVLISRITAALPLMEHGTTHLLVADADAGGRSLIRGARRCDQSGGLRRVPLMRRRRLQVVAAEKIVTSRR